MNEGRFYGRNEEKSYGGSGAGNGRNRKNSSSRARRLFFLGTTVWGYAMGSASICIIARFCGADLDPGVPSYVIALITLAAALLGGLIFHRAYREYRKKKSKI